MYHVLFNDKLTLLVIRDCRKPCFGAKRTEIGEKSQKMGNSYFPHDCPFSTNVKKFSVYSTVPCMTYQTFKSIE